MGFDADYERCGSVPVNAMNTLNKFLRYNSRHHFYWRVGGPYGKTWPMLNPISTVHGGGNKNIELWEPLWLFRLRQRLFAFAGRQRCGRRDEGGWWGRTDDLTPDTWDRGPDGNRTCSYCGSLHPEDFFALVKAAADAGPDAGDDVPSIDPSDKGYKVYVRQKGVRNASEGGIKFYTQHLPRPVPVERNAEYSKAVQASRVRFERQMATANAAAACR